MAIHSDWSDWLPRAIASAEPDGVAVWYLGCNGFVLKGREGTTIFVDPYLGLGDPPRIIRMIPVPFEPDDVRSADAILATTSTSITCTGRHRRPSSRRRERRSTARTTPSPSRATTKRGRTSTT